MRRRDRRDGGFASEYRAEVDESVRWVPDAYEYPDLWKCRDSEDGEGGGDGNDDDLSGDGDSGTKMRTRSRVRRLESA